MAKDTNQTGVELQAKRVLMTSAAAGLVASTIPTVLRAFEARLAVTHSPQEALSFLVHNPGEIKKGMPWYVMRQMKCSAMGYPVSWFTNDILAAYTTLPLGMRSICSGVIAAMGEVALTRGDESRELAKKYGQTPSPSAVRTLGLGMLIRSCPGWSGAAFAAGYGREHQLGALQQAQLAFMMGLVTGAGSTPLSRGMLNAFATNRPLVEGYKEMLKGGAFSGWWVRAATVGIFNATALSVKYYCDHKATHSDTSKPDQSSLSNAQISKLNPIIEDVLNCT